MINIVRIWAAVNTHIYRPNNGLDRMDMAVMCNLIKYRLQDIIMCPLTKLYPEPDLSA